MASGGEVATEEAWFRPDGRALHIELARWAEVVLVAPATADALAKAALGLADDLLSATLLAGAKRVAWAPAMNEAMWLAPQTQAHVRRLEELGHAFFGPAYGPWPPWGRGGMGADAGARGACGAVTGFPRAQGPLGPPPPRLRRAHPGVPGPGALPLQPLLGPDGLRRGRGRPGPGAEVVLVSGPTALPDPWGVEVVRVESALEMRKALLDRYPWAQAVVMAAAVADYRPAETLKDKEPKAEAEKLLRLVPNPDILRELGERKEGRVLVGFAMETREGLERARGSSPARTWT